MLKLSEEFAIGADDYSVIVLKKVYHKNPDGSDGDPYWKNDGYFLKVSQALKHILNSHIKEISLSEDVISIKDLLARISSVEDELDKIKMTPIKSIITKQISKKTVEIVDLER